ncbi:serine/threonine protein kinase, partial [Streptomyces sp. 2MCAF27]
PAKAKAAAPASGSEIPPAPQPPRAPLTDVVPKRTLVIIAVIVALAVVGTVLAIALSGGDDGGDQGKSGGRGTASAGASGDVKDGRDSGNQPGQSSSRSPEPETSTKKPADDATKGGSGGSDDDGDDDSNKGKGGGDGKGSQPDGYATVKSSDFPFTMAMPKEWKAHAGTYSGSKIYYGGSDIPRIQIDFTTSPKSDAAAEWRKSEPAVSRSTPGYKLISIESVKWHGYPTVADWQFERDKDGKRVRVLNRGFRADDSHGFAIMITCEKSKWDEKECKTLRETAFDTFDITD